MQRFDMLLALCRTNVGSEVMQRLSQIDPLVRDYRVNGEVWEGFQ